MFAAAVHRDGHFGTTATHNELQAVNLHVGEGGIGTTRAVIS
jgi:hypothetical protein